MWTLYGGSIEQARAAVDRLVDMGCANYVEYNGTSQGYSPLHLIGMVEDQRAEEDREAFAELQRVLVAAGAEVDPTHCCYGVENKATPLHIAIDNGCLHAARVLVDLGADVYADSASGTIDERLLAPMKELFDEGSNEEHREFIANATAQSLSVLADIGYDHLGELTRALETYIAAARAGGPDPSESMHYQCRRVPAH